jgi:hypothetical protein
MTVNRLHEPITADPQEAARVLNRYARKYSAGAFATPTIADMGHIIERGELYEWDGVLAVAQWQRHDSQRTDWTGTRYTIPAATMVIKHIAVAPGAKVPNLSGFGRVFGYHEDRTLTAAMESQRREVCATRISAASEIISCWGRTGSRREYQPWDAATLVRLPPPVTRDELNAAAWEAKRLDGWFDDYPFYSDGSWSALSLRGFNPADPTWGAKPSEMSKAWHAQHPEARNYRKCDWTVLADKLPACRNVINAVSWWPGLERVRLLKMSGRAGKPGKLLRHTDVTDKAAGTRDGQIIRFHIPLVTTESVTMTAWNLAGHEATVHLPLGSMWYLDARKPHAVTNASGIDRIHLVVDVLADQFCRNAITQGTEYCP